MKKIITGAIFTLFTVLQTHAQYRINSSYKPLTFEEAYQYAMAKAAAREAARKRFNEYVELAYKWLNQDNYYYFIKYSDIALETGLYNNQLYYDRGQAYENMNEFGKAKKEYKKSLRHGYYPAKTALEVCKQRQKVWKDARK